MCLLAQISGVRGPIVYVVKSVTCRNGIFKSIVSVNVGRDLSWLVDYGGFTITLRHTIHGRTPLDEGSARRRYSDPTTYNVHERKTSVSLAGIEPTIPASERPQTYALDSAATGTVRQPQHLDVFFK